MTLRQIGEEKLLTRILPHLPANRRVIVRAGDDCAVVRFRGAGDLLLLKSDCVVEGVHFTRKTPAPAAGWKAMMRPLSDFAAMSGVPEFALITIVISGDKQESWLRQFYRGLNRAAKRFNVAIVGGETGDTNGSTAVSVSVAGYAEPRRWVGRNGGKMNDDLFVTGELGGAIRLRHLNFVPRLAEARWLTRFFDIHAMIDLSDGLGSDLPRLARASNLSFVVNEKALPIAPGCSAQQAISDGEDYELLFALSPRDRAKLEASWKRKFPTIRLSCIGRLVRRTTSHDRTIPPGYVHFQQRR